MACSPKPRGWGKKAYTAGERPELKKTEAGARVTLTSVYAEGQYVIMGYKVEDLKDDRRVAGYPAELHPTADLGSGEPTPREEEYLKKYGLGTDIVSLTDESGTKFRMVINSGESFAGSEHTVEGPLQNMEAFKPEEGLEPGEDHRFRLEIPLEEHALVPPEEKELPPEPFPGKPFVFEVEIPVRPVPVIEVGQKETVGGVTLTLDRVIDSPVLKRAVFCYEAPDDERRWFLQGGKGTTPTAGMSANPSMKSVPPAGRQELLLRGPLDGRSSVEVKRLTGAPDCRSVKGESAKACNAKIGAKTIRGPWRFEFDAPTS